jgi:hypothetical protein
MADTTRLKTWLQSSGLQKQNQPLYQVIKNLIEIIDTLTAEIAAASSSGSSSSTTTIINQISNVPGPRGRDGRNGLPGPRGVDGSTVQWSVLTDGAGNIIFAGGDVVMVHTP